MHYNDEAIGEYFPDLLVEDVLSGELKIVNVPDDTHMPPGA